MRSGLAGIYALLAGCSCGTGGGSIPDDTHTGCEPLAWYPDADADGYGDESAALFACEPPSGLGPQGGDCDDADPAVHPAATEGCDGADDDCDGAVDEDSDGDGWTPCDGDCDDGDPGASPDGEEICNDGSDNDCDGTDNGCPPEGAKELAWATLKIRGDDRAASFGSGLAVGEIDGDGIPDLLVGAPGAPSDELIPQVGAVHLIPGSALRGASGETTAGPLSAAILHGQTAPGGATPDQLGTAVASGGDVDGDGYDDILIRGRAEDAGELDTQPAWLLRGGPSLPTSSLDQAQAQIESVSPAYMGQDVALADLNGDAWADVLVGAWVVEQDTQGIGHVYGFFGPLSGIHGLSKAQVMFTGAPDPLSAQARFADVGDTDGDGYADILMGNERDDLGAEDAGAVYLFLGPTTGGERSALDADAVMAGEGLDDNAGRSVAGVGDLNGDGYPDVAVGAWYWEADATKSEDEGVVYLVHGPLPEEQALSQSEIQLRGEETDLNAGRHVAAAGDVDGDGYDDVLVGTTWRDNVDDSPGYAFLVRGPVEPGIWSLWEAGAHWVGEADGDWGGAHAVGLGDVDGDGRDDVMLSAIFEGADSAGAAYLFTAPGL